MTTSFKKLLLISITLLLGVISGEARADTTNICNGPSDCSLGFQMYSTLSNESTFDPINQPWWGNESAAFLYAQGGAAYDAYINSGITPVQFAYGAQGGVYRAVELSSAGITSLVTGSIYENPNYAIYAFAFSSNTNSIVDYVNTGGDLLHLSGSPAPEMNASFIPQVALMLACLFFLLGRKKENTELMLAA